MSFRAEAEQWLRDRIEAGRKLGAQSTFGLNSANVTEALNSGEHWLDVVRRLLARIFDTPDFAEEWRTAHFRLVKPRRSSIDQAQMFREMRDRYVSRLRAVLDSLPYIEEILPSQSSPHGTISDAPGRDVFVVHGHDTAATEAVARVLMTLDLRPIILEEEPNAGKTIIEKLEGPFEAGGVGYAVVIMTPDDRGAAKDQIENLKPRARQNVIMELGYSIGLLGRARVCVLYRSGVELPSNYHGVVYILLDDVDAWKHKLGKELHAAGIDVDLNKI